MGGWVLLFAAVQGLLVKLRLAAMAQFGILLPMTLFIILGGMMIPVYVVGKKYHERHQRREGHENTAFPPEPRLPETAEQPDLHGAQRQRPQKTHSPSRCSSSWEG